jgi:3'-phosphoadenosine 5'-phosphosulfate synthase
VSSGFTALGYFLSGPNKLLTAAKELSPRQRETVAEQDDERLRIENFINSTQLARSLREDPAYTETRPHKQIPAGLKAYSMTAGTLSGPGKIVVPPLVWSLPKGAGLVSIAYLGEDLCGHPGIIHGGLLATLLDEGLARCCFPALPNKLGVTANLTIDYRSPAHAKSYIVLRAETTKVEGRKAWVKGRIETLPMEGEAPLVLAEATALFIEPKGAAVSEIEIIDYERSYTLDVSTNITGDDC